MARAELLQDVLVSVVLVCVCALPISEQATVMTSIHSEELKSASLGKNETACFVYHMDEATTKQVIRAPTRSSYALFVRDLIFHTVPGRLLGEGTASGQT